MPRRFWMARSSSPSFLAAQMNTQMTAANVKMLTAASTIPRNVLTATASESWTVRSPPLAPVQASERVLTAFGMIPEEWVPSRAGDGACARPSSGEGAAGRPQRLDRRP